uniref:Xaa-Pro aminopeptidase n=1 Tax=Candidatus Aschnera chinzeii TaxID=1485666 RepID=A0AAT9G426_9ENTR|nr:MAG: Xaa-Pro aminopeptidase [Candidatus Aschnera chinzeii]
MLLTKMEHFSAAIFFSAPIVYRNSDCSYPYRQDSDFWYLTGISESHSVLMIIKYNDTMSKSIIFHQISNKYRKTWIGNVLNKKDIIKYYKIDNVYSYSKINNCLYKLLNGLDIIYHAVGKWIYADEIILSALDKLRNNRIKYHRYPHIQIDWRPIVHEMRLFKSALEIDIIKHACNITCNSILIAMKSSKINMYEYELAAMINYHFALDKSNPAYTTIVASGKNTCILHYTKYNSIINNGDLILIDAGAEYKNYASDITRTFPVNGIFSKAQRDIYNIVLLALNTALNLYKPGTSIKEVTDYIIKLKIKCLMNLGILSGSLEELFINKAYLPFFMHNLSHWIGLDVHDVGYYGIDYNRILEPGMVLTIEPGIYINETLNVPKIYKNIGIRIEDIIVITDHGNKNLSSHLTKNPDEIELVIQNKSNNNWKL